MFSGSQIDPITGIECTFFTIIMVNIDRRAQVCHVVLGGWLSQALYDAGKAPSMEFPYDWSGAQFPLPDSNPIAANLRNQFETVIQNLAPFKV